MKEIISRLQEKREIEVAKSILENAGYTIEDPTEEKNLKESNDEDLYNALAGIEWESISEKDGVYYVSSSKPFSQKELNKVYNALDNCTGAGFEDNNLTMWFTFD